MNILYKDCWMSMMKLELLSLNVKRIHSLFSSVEHTSSSCQTMQRDEETTYSPQALIQNVHRFPSQQHRHHLSIKKSNVGTNSCQSHRVKK